MNHSENKPRDYQLIDYVKLICTFMVICVHSNQVVDNEFVNFFIKNVFCRVAVPFFFVSSAYLFRERMSVDPNYLKSKIRRLSQNYLLWSIVYLPIGFAWLNDSMTVSRWMYPLALLFGEIYTGTYYHLWYIPALLFSIVLATKLLKHFSYKLVISLSLCFYLFGSLETYYGLLPESKLKQSVDSFISLFFTTRNGLMYGLVFVLIGFYIFDHKEQLIKLGRQIHKFLGVSAIGLVIEGSLIYQIHSSSLDNNFILALIPFSFFFFLWIISIDFEYPFSTQRIREHSEYFYYIHPISVIIIPKIGEHFHLSALTSGWCSYFLICLLTVSLANVLARIKRHGRKQMYFPSFFLSLTCLVVVCFHRVDLFSVLRSEFLAGILIFSTIIIAPYIQKWLESRRVQLIVQLLKD